MRAAVSMLVLGLEAVGPGAVAHSSDGATSVAVLALPDVLGGKATPATQGLAQRIAADLQAAGFRVVRAGIGSSVPVEELNAIANASSVDLALGLRGLGETKRCPSLVAPQALPLPVQTDASATPAQASVLVRQITAAARSEASGRLVRSLASVREWCHPQPTEVEKYVLDGIAAPTVLMAVAVHEAGVTQAMPAILREWSARLKK
jgi:hypothetical protein